MLPIYQLRRCWPALALLSFFLALTLHVSSPQPVQSSLQPGSPVPGIQDKILNNYPDWSQITFADFPPFAEGGGFEAPQKVIDALGFDPSRDWNAGDLATQVGMLGDFQDSLALGEFSLEHLAEIVGIDIEAFPLSELEGLLGKQTLTTLVDAIPTLADLKISDVPLVADLVRNFGGGIPAFSRRGSRTIADLLRVDSLKDLPFGESLDLSEYGVDAIPGLSQTPIDQFANWQTARIEDIPGLQNVPFAAMPNPISNAGVIVGTTDIVLSAAEGGMDRSISGSYESGFNVPCAENCAHIEIAQPSTLQGTQWISGKYQQVKGGHGILGTVNSGLEPTGRHPFGSAFKVVVLETDEATGTADTGLFFRYCQKTAFIDLGCTPYFIGPIPFLPIEEEGLVFLGQSHEGLSHAIAHANIHAAATTSQPVTPTTINSSRQSTPQPARSTADPAIDLLRYPLLSESPATTPFEQNHRDPLLRTITPQNGIELSAPAGTPVLAADAGRVTYAGMQGSETTGYGNLVIIDHSDGRQTYYAHLQAVLVRAGDIVAAGDVVGQVGNTGDSTAPQLRFEVRENDIPVDPTPYLG
ncbi:MAG: M23 family metallopeptidase [Cyanothece sp. SIO1E1]|nr:M23 family metallopeptidase [Cyanothece sp. SIO1E1]